MYSAYSKKDQELFKRATALSKVHLSSIPRLEGDSFFDHNVRVGEILALHTAEPEIVIAGLLHGILNHVEASTISKEFGTAVLTILREVESLKRVKAKNTSLESESLRKIIITTLKDVRVIIIKLAGKLDNLRTIHVFSAKRQKEICEEVIDIYAPLAYRLGLDKMKTQLEDLAFKALNPRKYKEINVYLEESRQQREENVEKAISLIKRISKNKVDIVKIKGRPKHIYSIYKKITKRKVPLHEQFDLLGIRALCKTIKDCYTLLGILHEEFEPCEGRLKDYIANPKPNFYRSIHTAVTLSNGKIAEIQIRTPEMDEFAEEGVAAHWRYKGVKSDQLFEKKMSWLKSVLDLQKNEFLDSVKVDLFGDKIYCYTPKGDVKELPLGATILDFAYLVHEQIGSKCVGGRINGKFVRLKEKLTSGDVVEIITNKNQRPRRGWIKIVTSAKARQKIRKMVRQYDALPSLHYRTYKPTIKEDLGVLVHSEEFPKAMCVLAKCCSPVPIEEIAGIMTKRRMISVHSTECREAIKEENRWIPVEWKTVFNQKISFMVEADERSGLLADLLNTIARSGFEIKEAKGKLRGKETALCNFIVIPRDMDELLGMIKRVKKVRGVRRLYFD